MDYILFHEHIQLPPFFHTHALINITYVNKRACWFWAVLYVSLYWQMYVVCVNFRICLQLAMDHWRCTLQADFYNVLQSQCCCVFFCMGQVNRCQLLLVVISSSFAVFWRRQMREVQTRLAHSLWTYFVVHRTSWFISYCIAVNSTYLCLTSIKMLSSLRVTVVLENPEKSGNWRYVKETPGIWWIVRKMYGSWKILVLKPVT